MIRKLALILVVGGLAGCAASEPSWCHRWHPVYLHGRRCASGRPVASYEQRADSEPVVYVDDCAQCYDGNARTGGQLTSD